MSDMTPHQTRQIDRLTETDSQESWHGYGMTRDKAESMTWVERFNRSVELACISAANMRRQNERLARLDRVAVALAGFAAVYMAYLNATL